MAQEDSKIYPKLLTRHLQPGVVLSPEVLLFYKGIDRSLPMVIVQAIDAQLKREYRYAIIGQVLAGITLILVAVGFIFLVMFGHERPAYALLGAGVLNVIGGFLHARLNNKGRKY